MAVGKRVYHGTHSARLNSVVITKTLPRKLLFPMGGFLLTYDAETMKKTAQMYLFEDVILCVLLLPQSDDHLIATSYSGQFVLTALSGLRVHTCSTSHGIITQAELNPAGTHLATCCEFGNNNGVIEVWSVSLEQGFAPLFRVSGNYSTCNFTPAGALFCLRMSPLHVKGQSTLFKNRPIPIERATDDFPEQPEPSLDELNADLEMHEIKECTYYACRFSLTVASDRRAVPIDIAAGLICARESKGRFVGSFQGRVVLVMRMDTLEKLAVIQVLGSSVLQSLSFVDDHSVMFVPFTGVICTLDLDASDIPSVLDVKTAAPECVSVLKTNKDWINSDDCYVAWVEPGRTIVAFDDCNFYTGRIDLSSGGRIETEQSVGGLQLSACGVTLSPDGHFAAVGDLSGQLLIVRLTPDGPTEAALHETASDSFLLPAFECSAGVTSLREKEIDSRLILAIGTVGGEVILMDYMPIGELILIKTFIAHKPQEGFDSSSYFGSLKHFSEVWSMSWSPAPHEWQLASSSEDQTVVVWDLETETQLAVLPKHKRAVTGVSWKVLQNGWERLISCSDDRSVRVYEARSWLLLHTFYTSFIREWHTLTYAEIDEKRSRAIVVSQNGYLFVMDLEGYTVVYSKKIHYGSVEGLSVVGDKIATCSSECSLCVLDITDTLRST